MSGALKKERAKKLALRQVNTGRIARRVECGLFIGIGFIAQKNAGNLSLSELA